MSNARSERVPPLAARPSESGRPRRSYRSSVGGRLPGRRTLAKAAIVLVGIAAASAGLLGMRVDRGGHEAAAIGEVIGIPNGEMRVDAVRYWNEGQH